MPKSKNDPRLDVYHAAKALSEFMKTNNGAATGELVAALHKAIEKYEKQRDPAEEFL